MVFFSLVSYDKITLGGYMEIELAGQKIAVDIIRKANKNIYFRIIDGRIVVTCNSLATKGYIEQLIKKNEKALLKMYNKAKAAQDEDAFFNYLGEQYTILYNEDIKQVQFENDIVMAKNKKMLDSFYLKQVDTIFRERVEKCKLLFDDIPDFLLRFRKMKTRWGVNNVTEKIITLNTELLKKEISLLDYVIIHEICHFYEANHSSRFWEQVQKRYPYYKLARKKLRGE